MASTYGRKYFVFPLARSLVSGYTVPMNSTLISTRYPKSIKHSSEASVLKPGRNNKKLGWKITKGKWKGKYLYSLTLTERATCPTSCHHWDDCYGNNMPFAHRFDTRGLIQKLEQEIPQLLSKHKKGIVIRLHVLGDFYSVDYARFWQKMLVQYDDLCIFGYTARELDSKIGRAIWLNNIRFSDRHVIRWSRNYTSDELGKWFAAEESFDGNSFDCPEQTGKVDSCADCGLCWTAQKTVRFLSH